MYAVQSPEVVFSILKKYEADYLILEESICLSPPKANNCSLKEILDIDNGHVRFFNFFKYFYCFKNKSFFFFI